MLTEAEIRAVKASEKPLKLFDGGGLYLCSSIQTARDGGD
jgi:hypothetical protein